MMPDWLSLEWVLTLSGLVLGIAAYFYASHIAGLPRDDQKPRLLPWRLFSVFAAFWVVLMLVHIFNLFGVETGPDKSPFMRY